jgi:N-acetyl-alpha-D-glucosaminyl L-malate synthase BshA
LKSETERIFKTRRPISVIPNFVDPEAFRPQTSRCRREQFARPEEKILLHISNFRPVKNIPTLVRVFDAVRRRHPARLLLVGDGPERLPVEELVAELGLTDAVSFLGSQEYVEDIIPLADAFLLPSLHESFGLVVLEAMAMGVPVVATNTGGTPEVVGEGECGFLRDPKDVDGQVEAILRLLEDPELGRRMGENGIRRARERFAMDHVVDRYLEVYASCP